MKIPDIKVEKVGDDIVCKITYDNIVVEAGYKSDGTPFAMSNKSLMDISNDFRRISSRMWKVVCDKFNMNPGCALEAGLIDLNYCKQMQFACIVGYDLCSMALYESKSYRVKNFFKEYLK